MADHVGVMYLGRLCEAARVDDIFDNPLHPYTRALLSAIPIPEPGRKRERIILSGVKLRDKSAGVMFEHAPRPLVHETVYCVAAPVPCRQ